MLACGKKNNASPTPRPRDVQAWIPRGCKYIVLLSKKYFEGVVKVLDLKMGRLSCIIPVDPI